MGFAAVVLSAEQIVHEKLSFLAVVMVVAAAAYIRTDG
jgi:hypothetical protein